MYPDLSKEAAEETLKPFHDLFVKVIKEAVRKFNEIQPASALLALSTNARVRANAIWGFVAAEVPLHFGDVAGLKTEKPHGSLEFHIGNNMVARIKKMRVDGFTSNYMTARVSDFHTADQGELFPNMWAQPMRVDIGYIEDETGLQIAEIMVARRENPRTIAWTYPITTPATVTPMPAEAPSPATEVARVVAREAEADENKQAQGTDE